MALEKQSPDEGYDRANGRKLRPPVFDTRMTEERGSEDEAKSSDRPLDKDQNRLTKTR